MHELISEYKYTCSNDRLSLFELPILQCYIGTYLSCEFSRFIVIIMVLNATFNKASVIS
jgi:hypothetical protein